MAQLQHWSVTCTTCDSPAEYHCNTCGDILCPRCREIHQRSGASGHHSIVPYAERVKPGKLIGQCGDHHGQQCLLWCQRCDKEVCTDCVASADHEGHKFVKMPSKLEEQRKIMQEEFDNYSKLLKQWEDSLQKFQSNMKAYDSNMDELGKEITKAADRICEQVRGMEAALHKQLQVMKTTQTNVLREHEKNLLDGMEGIKLQIKETEDKLRSDDIQVILHYKRRENESEMETPPILDTLTFPIFTPGKIETQSLGTMLGNLMMRTSESLSVKKGKAAAEHTDSPTSTASHEDMPKTSSAESSSKRSLLPVSAVLSVVQADKKEAPFLACDYSGQAWMRNGATRLQLLDKQGVVKKTVDTGFISIGGMTTSQQGGLLISDYKNKTIVSITDNGKVESLFKTELAPYGICCLQNGDVVVAFTSAGRVFQYNRTGREVRELDRSLFKYPRNVAQNKINEQIYVIDKSDHRVSSSSRLLAFNLIGGQLEYEYSGSEGTTFTPWDVCTDQAGHVIITDWSNDRIHILDQDGRFLQYMLTEDQGLYRPYSIDTDNDGVVWVSENNYGETSRLKLLKYIN